MAEDGVSAADTAQTQSSERCHERGACQRAPLILFHLLPPVANARATYLPEGYLRLRLRYQLVASSDPSSLCYGSPSLGGQTRLWLNSAVDFAAMADIDNQDQQAIVDDLVNDAVVPDPDAVDIFATAELGVAMRPWLNGQCIDGIAEAQVQFAIGQGPQRFFCAPQDLNRVGHSIRP